MTGDKFLRLRKGDEVCTLDDDNVYQVVRTDNMGRIEMQKVVYFIDDFEHRDDEFDSFDECLEYLHDLREGSDDLDVTASDIEERLDGDTFWMHYTDVYNYY